MIPPKNFTVKFIKKEEAALQTESFFFERPPDFEFIAGQYNRWTLPITANDRKGNSRLFSISSSPLGKDFVCLTTKLTGSDFKNGLLNLKEGDQIQMFGPMGRFVLDENDSRKKVFISGGIGITPFHSILNYVSGRELNMPITLLASFSTPEEMIFLDNLKQIENHKTNIKVVYSATRPEQSKIKWEGETGRIGENMIKKYVQNISESIFYVVGPPAMVESTKQMLLETNISLENIKVEQFTGY